MNTGLRLFILFFCFGSPLSAYSIPFTGQMYEQGTQKQKLLFNLKRTEEEKGAILSAKIVFTSPEGREVVTEELIMQNGKVSKYVIHHHQLGEKRELEVKDKKIVFKNELGGKIETDEEDLTDNLVVGPSLVSYLKEHWADLLKGNEISVRYAALDRKETVGFNLFKIEEGKKDGRDVMVVKMKPSSFIIAALVKPLIFIFDKPTGNLVEIRGRTLPKQKVGNGWKDLDTDGVYQY